MLEVFFLLLLGLIWILFATIQDLKYKEVANWLNFSLIIFALGFRLFFSLFEGDFNFLYQGLIGLGVFFVIGNLFYYSKIFAGGDAKLMIALGTVLPVSYFTYVNFDIFLSFIFVFLVVGAIYGFTFSLYLMFKNFKNFKKEFSKQFKKNKILVNLLIFFGVLIMLLGFVETMLFYLGFLVFLISYLFVYSKAIDEACMIKKIKPRNLVEGDWLYKDLIFGKNKIKASWHGLNRKEIKLLQKNKREILIRQGIPFVPVFLISYLVIICLWKSNWIPNLFVNLF